MHTPFRRTTQRLAPAHHESTLSGQYDIYPGFDVGGGKIQLGHAALAEQLLNLNHIPSDPVGGWIGDVILDGYGGVFWDNLRDCLDAELQRRSVRVAWHDINVALKPEADIDALIAPFLGDDDPLFGVRFTGYLRDFFIEERLHAIKPDPNADINLVYGCGAALCDWDGWLVYVDVPKNEIQFRSRAGRVSNLGAGKPCDPKMMYKRFYFVDWVALNQHKAELLPRIDVMVDEQRPGAPALMSGGDLRAALTTMSRDYFRVRPWFEPGPWGGQWIKRHIPHLPQDAPNYAWSFELIAPENGLMLESDGNLLEVSFDCLMFHAYRDVLGKCADRFGYDFPIRFDFLDTFDGGNLSVQCHPRPEYIRKHFGENFTQDETYYILDCAPDARVFLGFKDDINPQMFREALEAAHGRRSFHEASPVDVDRFVNSEPAHKGDLFLIPNGTIHCSGKDNLVLEISATPYIFTFKMYDWMRLDLDGRPRPLNIARAFDNLYFERKGDRVREALVSHPRTLAEGADWRAVHLPTHREHFYDVHRLEFATSISAETNGSCQVMNLVEGSAILLETGNGLRQRFNFAETFVVPAAAERFRLINLGDRPAKVVKCFMKASD